MNKHGDIAQLGERLPCTQEVRSSILLVSTNLFAKFRLKRDGINKQDCAGNFADNAKRNKQDCAGNFAENAKRD